MNKLITLVITILFSINRKKITILFQGYSGSNLTPIIRELENNEDYNIKIIQNYNDKFVNELELFKRILFKMKRRISMFWNLSTSNLVITTHGYRKLNYRTTMLNMWHGIPIKSMGLMRNGRKDDVNFITDDIFLSTSILFNTVMNSCMGIYGDKYVITGYPRNDLLLESKGLDNIRHYFDLPDDTKIIIYMPTYSSSATHNNDFPGFDSFDLYEFDRFLNENNLTFIMKLHPNEEKRFNEILNEFDFKALKVLESNDLDEHKMDLYEVLNASSLLLTDYSSVYFDYLLLDRPIIFNKNNLEYYRKERGLLLEPYEFWTPGAKINTQKELQSSILNSIENPEEYGEKREEIRKLFHKYEDSNSTERVIELIYNIMNN